jgi:hypothetical protein
MKKTKISSYFLFITIFSVLALSVYIIQKGYGRLIGPIEKVQTSHLTQPINPHLDIEIINQIEKRQEFDNSIIDQSTTKSASLLK